MESSRKPATRRGGQGFILFYFVAPRGGGVTTGKVRRFRETLLPADSLPIYCVQIFQ